MFRNKKFLFYIPLVLFIFISSFYLFHSASDNHKIIVHTDLLSFYEGSYVDGLGSCIFSSESEEGNPVFAYLDQISLQKGSYTIDVEYLTDTSASCYFLTSDTVPIRDYLSDQVILNPFQTSISSRFTIKKASDDYSFHFTFSKDGTLVIKQVVLTQNMDYPITNVCKAGFALLLFYGLTFLYRKKNKIADMPVYFALAGIVLLSSLPLFTGYLYKAPDLDFHLYRIQNVADGFRSHQFPLRIAPDWMSGYGYAAPIMYSDFFLIIPGIMRLLGFTIQGSYQFYIFLINIATTGIAYFSFKKLSNGSKIGLILSAVYTLAPYRLINLYVRAALGEYTAMAFLPLIICGFVWILLKEQVTEKKKGILYSILGLSGIIQCHVLSCEMAGIFLILFCLLHIREVFHKETLLSLLKVVLITLLLNLWWIVPFLTYMREDFTVSSRSMDYIQGQGLLFGQIFLPFTNACNSSLDVSLGLSNDMQLSIGLALTCILIMAISLPFSLKEKTSKITITYMMKGILLGFLSLWLTSASFPYDAILDRAPKLGKILCMIQFPWRYLTIAVIVLCCVGCVVFQILQSSFSKELYHAALLGIGCIALICSSYTIYSIMTTASSYYVYDSGAMEHSSNGAGNNEYLPTGTITYFPENQVIASEGISYDGLTKDYLSIQVTVQNTSTDGYLEIPLLYYKGYQGIALDSGENLATLKGDNNLVRVEIPANFSGTIAVNFREMWYWRVSEILSLITVLFCIVKTVRARKS